jgi:hypothetical protein
MTNDEARRKAAAWDQLASEVTNSVEAGRFGLTRRVLLDIEHRMFYLSDVHGFPNPDKTKGMEL